MPVRVECAAPKIATQFDARDIFEIDRNPILLHEHCLLDVFHIGDQTKTTHHELHAVLFDGLAADIEIRLTNGHHDHAHRNADGAHLLRVHLDLILANETAHTSHLGHARHCIQLIANVIVLQRPQLAQIITVPTRWIDIEVVLIDPPKPRGIRPQLRLHTCWQIERSHTLHDLLPCRRLLDFIIEDHIHQREPKHARRSHGLHTGKSLKAYGQRIRDLILDLLRATPHPIGKHDYLVFAEIGQSIHRRFAHRPDAEYHDRKCGAYNEEAVPQRPSDERIDHGFTSIPHSSISLPQ